MVEEACQDYSKLLLSVNLDNEINPICISIDDMLTRLDELESLLVNVKCETNVIVEQHTNSILAFSPHFEILKGRINKLENFMEMVNKNVDDVERSIDVAETELNVTDFSFKSLLFKPLLAKAKSVSEQQALSPTDAPLTATNLKDGEFQSVPIYSTAQFFKSET